MKALYAPEIDSILEGIGHNPPEINRNSYFKLLDTYTVFSCVHPGDSDEYRFTWIEVERGPVEAFGDYKEFKSAGEVKNRKEFKIPGHGRWAGCRFKKH